MANAKRKRKPLPKAVRKITKQTRTRSGTKKKRVRVTSKNGKRIAPKVRKVKRRGTVTRKIGTRKSNRVTKGKTRKVRSTKRRATKRVTKRRATKRVTNRRAKQSPEFTGTIVPNFNEGTMVIELPKGNFDDKLNAVKALPIEDGGILHKFFRMNFPPVFPRAIFVTLKGIESDGGEYFLNRVMPPDQLPEPIVTRDFLIEQVTHWADNFFSRQMANTLSEKPYDKASSPDNLENITVKYLYPDIDKMVKPVILPPKRDEDE